MKTYLFIFIGLILSTSTIFGQSMINGSISEHTTLEPLIGSHIKVYERGIFVTGINSDLDGLFQFDLKPGTYDFEFSYIGYQSESRTDIVVRQNESVDFNIVLNKGVYLDEIVITCYVSKQIRQKIISCGGIISSHQCFQELEDEDEEDKDAELISKDKESIKPATTLYPNPASNYVMVSANQAFKAIKILSSDGKVIFEQSDINQDQIEVQLSNLAAGIYFVYYCFEEQTEVKQFVKT